MDILYAMLERLRNDEHFQFHTEVIFEVMKIGAEKLKIEEKFQIYQGLHLQEDSALKRITKSEYTKLILEEKKKRDHLYSWLSSAVSLALKHYDVKVREAAEKVKIVLDTYGYIPSKRQDEATSAVHNLIEDLNSRCMEEMELLEIGTCASQLEACNTNFATLIRTRYEENRTNNKLVMKEVRAEIDKSYRDICEYVKAMMITVGGADYEQLISYLNVIVENYNRLARLNHSGRRKSTDDAGVETAE